MPDMIWTILKEQGRNKLWLARQIGYSHGFVRRVSCGAANASPEFRRRCAKALGLPESILFCPSRSTVESTTRAS